MESLRVFVLLVGERRVSQITSTSLQKDKTYYLFCRPNSLLDLWHERNYGSVSKELN